MDCEDMTSVRVWKCLLAKVNVDPADGESQQGWLAGCKEENKRKATRWWGIRCKVSTVAATAVCSLR